MINLRAAYPAEYSNSTVPTIHMSHASGTLDSFWGNIGETLVHGGHADIDETQSGDTNLEANLARRESASLCGEEAHDVRI